ncbi:MAG: methylmalonyl Co-A mutase-associated GTPase MeaB [Chromatiales bacterium]|nr:methylmalonyl Co-A mutase-associated GTPase MeaB [Chromatiales bacterium]
MDVEQLARDLRGGDRRALGRAITLVESTRPEDQALGDELLDRLAPNAGRSIRLGISGVPGVGKSTFIERFGMHVIEAGHRVAVLAVDPSSALSGGSILGDKTRMEELSRRTEAFIRPSPAGRTLGGVTRHTQETMLLVEAAGFDVVVVETVGVGQSETAVAEMTDMFLLLLLPGGGDELQGIKRGIVELADLVVVNKADGELAAVAGRSAADYRSALRFLRSRNARWEVPVQTCSALSGEGIPEIWETVSRYRALQEAEGELERRRANQARSWLWSETTEQLVSRLREDQALARRLGELEQAVASGSTAPRVAARELVDAFWKERQTS